MSTNSSMQSLHDRAIRGESLSESEKAQLEAWYRAQDEYESDLLSKNAPPDSVVEIKKQIKKIWSELNKTVLKNTEILTENKILRQENEVLREKLAEKLSLKIV